jgi:hypothetical protein
VKEPEQLEIGQKFIVVRHLPEEGDMGGMDGVDGPLAIGDILVVSSTEIEDEDYGPAFFFDRGHGRTSFWCPFSIVEPYVEFSEALAAHMQLLLASLLIPGA